MYYPFRIVFLLFILFSFVGWCSEVVYVGILSEHKFINRGFLYGPVCPIYGCGGIVLLMLPDILNDTWIPLFFAAMILCTAVEYVSSWILEKMFHTLWWDYSHYKVNINGRVCLLNSVLFGIMGVLGVHFVLPYSLKVLDLIPEMVQNISAQLLGVIFLVDNLFTIKRLVDFNIHMEKLREFKENLKEHYVHEEWFNGESLEEMLASVKTKAMTEKDKFSESFLEKIESIQKQHLSTERFIGRFPTIKSSKYTDGLNFTKSLKAKREAKK